MSYDLYKPPSHRLGSIRDNDYIDWPVELIWVIERKFPKPLESQMSAILDRAFNLISNDRIVLDRLFSDAIWLGEAFAQRADKSIVNQRTDHCSDFAALQFSPLLSPYNLNWHHHFAMQAILSLSACLYIDAFGLYPDDQSAPDVECKNRDKDEEIAEIIYNLLLATEFIEIAETWSKSNQSETLDDMSIRQTMKESNVNRTNNTAYVNHQPRKGEFLNLTV